MASNVKQHKANIHDIDVTYYLCGEDGCDYKAKKGSNVFEHKRRLHGFFALV